MEVSKLFESQPVLLNQLRRNASNVEAVDMVTDRLAMAGLCRPRGDVSGLGALRTEATLHAMKRGNITQDKAAADLRKWGLL